MNEVKKINTYQNLFFNQNTGILNFKNATTELERLYNPLVDKS